MTLLLDDSLASLELELAYETTFETDELAARRSLRTQIAKLERDLGACLVSAFGHVRLNLDAPAPGGPRLLSIGELEALRDDLADRLRQARVELERRGEHEASVRLELERMRRDPAAHRHVQIAAVDLGEPGCGHWRVRPRLGLIGMLLGWWRVTLSSGCPLAT